ISMNLKKQIKEMLKAGKLSYLIKELKQNNGKEQPKTTKKRETPGKEKTQIFFPPLGEDEGIKGPMIIEAEIGGHCIHRMYVDGGSASEILYEHCFNRLHREIKNQLVPAITPLIGFSGEVIWPIGQIQLLVIIGDEEHSASAWMNFVVIRSPSSYNGIIGRPGFRNLQAVLSTAHGMLKIPVEGGIITLKSIMLVPLECAMVSGPEGSLLVTKLMVEERIKVAINPKHPEQTIMTGFTLTEEGLNKLCSLLQRNLDIFAWKGKQLIEIKQYRKKLENFVEAGIMKEVHYHDWLSNPIMVKKRDGSWRMRAKVELKTRKLEQVFGQISRESLPFFKTLKKCTKNSDFHWTAEAEKAFKQMKQLIAELPMLTAPMEKEELIVYLAAAKETVSAVLMTERETKQMPIYFFSRALRGLEINYTSMENLVLALVHASKRLKRYFQAHPIIVVTDQPIQHVLSRPEVAGRLQKWSIKLGEYAIHYRPRVSVKEQLLADFIVEQPEEDSPDTLMTEEEKLPEPWILFMDGSSCTDGSGAGMILTNPVGMEFTYALRFRFDATNTEAEYDALISRLKIAEQMGVKKPPGKF
nr:reverse transcriptase domain-containing protein [Tanacetum cinerariifolium]